MLRTISSLHRKTSPDALWTSNRTTKPFLDYINRAIDFVREEKKEYFSSLDF